MEDKELIALIKLLGDTDQEVFSIVENRLLEEGLEIIPFLEKSWEKSSDSLLHERIEDIIQRIQFDDTCRNLKSWVKTDNLDLIEGAYWLSKYQYPDIKLNDVYQQFEVIINDIMFEINNNLTPIEKIRVINHVIFDIHKFSRNTSNLFSPQNYFINHVLELKKGNPMSMSMVYAGVAQHIGLPVYGVKLPSNFLLVYIDQEQFQKNPANKNALFYINPFNRGAMLGQKEINFFIKHQRLQEKEEYFAPCTNIEFVKEIILGLTKSYENLGYPEKRKDLQHLLHLI